MPIKSATLLFEQMAFKQMAYSQTVLSYFSMTVGSEICYNLSRFCAYSQTDCTILSYLSVTVGSEICYNLSRFRAYSQTDCIILSYFSVTVGSEICYDLSRFCAYRQTVLLLSYFSVTVGSEICYNLSRFCAYRQTVLSYFSVTVGADSMQLYQAGHVLYRQHIVLVVAENGYRRGLWSELEAYTGMKLGDISLMLETNFVDKVRSLLFVDIELLVLITNEQISS